jgi:hypothetical protein
METPLDLAARANNLKDRFLRACELKQTVNWEKIVHCFQNWAAGMKFDAPLILRVESAEQYKKALNFSRATIQSPPLHNARSELTSWTARAIQETRTACQTRAGKEMQSSSLIMWEATTGAYKKALFFAAALMFRRLRSGQLDFDSTTLFDIPRMSAFTIVAVEFGSDAELSRWYPLLEAFEAGAFCFVFTEHSIEVCTVPEKIEVDDGNRLHSESGPAFVWLGDIRYYYWHGVPVESYVLEEPERITVADIEAEPNDFIRKLKIERLGRVCPNMTLPRFPPVTADELKERYLRACELKQTVNWEKIVDCFRRWAAAFKIEVSTIGRLEDVERLKETAEQAIEWLIYVRHANRASPKSSVLGIEIARSQSRAYASWDQMAAKMETKAETIRRFMSSDVAGTRNTEWHEEAEGFERKAIYFREKSSASAANPANAARTRKITPAVRAAGNVWAGNVTHNGRTVSDVRAGWDVTLNAITVINTLEQDYQGINFSDWYPLFEAFEAGAFCYFITGRGIEVCTLPSMVKVDDDNRLHSDSGPAFAWLNDVRDYYWHGVRVESYVVDNPERITVAEIEGETNAEVRRVKIERFGQVRYLLGSGAQEVHRDDCGILYRKEIRGDEPLVLVKVVNATPEADGTFKDYILRVPPAMRTAREAVAWTFGKTANDYGPEQET